MVKITFKGDPIPDHLVQEIWQGHFSTKPCPRIKAFNVKPKRFHSMIVELHTLKGVEDTASREHGHEVPYYKRGGFVSKLTIRGEEMFVIVRKKTSKHSVEEVLRHEMQHIFNEI